MADESRKRNLAFSSEYPYKRWFGIEILDHKPGSVRMDFMKSGRAPLLMGHDQSQVIGIVESARIESKDKTGRAVVRFSRGADASERLADVDDGILVNVSTGYKVHELVLEKSTDTEDTYRVTDWEPLEASLVGIPADPTVGIGRQLQIPEDTPDGETQRAETEARLSRASSVVTPAKPAIIEVRRMDEKEAAAAAIAEVNLSAVEREKQRRQAIINICKATNMDSRAEAQWISDGTPFEDARDANGQVTRKGINTQILEVMEERGRQKPLEAARLGLTTTETQNFSLFRAIRALRFGNQNARFMREAAFEIECSTAVGKRIGRELTSSILIPSEILQRPLGIEASQRAMATTPGSKGGYAVGVQNMGFIDILRNRSVAMNMGSRVLSGLVGNVTFARQTGKVTVTWQAGEGTSVTAADQALGQLSMTPKTCIAITDVSEQLLAQATPSAEAFVMADLANDVAIDGVDNAVINGTGGAQPIGIKNTSGITSGQSASTFSYAKALAFPVAAGAVNAIRGNPGWVTNIAGASIGMQRQRFSSTDSPLWEGNLMDGQLVGFRAMSSEQLASGNIIFGSWDEVVIGEWGVLELSTDNGGTRFNTAQVGIRAMWMVDVMLRYPQAFVVGTDLS
jgi:HK97 family phage major capsid protein